MCILRAGVAKLVYAPDSKSGELHCSCRFESDLRHHLHRYSKASWPGAFLFADMWTINLSSFPTFR
jgi:hypothetical protein